MTPNTRRRNTLRAALVSVWSAVCVLALGGYPPRLSSAPPPLSDSELSYQLEEEPLAGFLERFFEAEGLPVVISAAVRSAGGTLSGQRAGSATEVLDSIAESNQLVVYYDGSTTYVYRANEVGTSYFSVPLSQVASLRAMLAEVSLGDARHDVRINPETGLVVASGSPRFLSQVEALATTVAARIEPVETTFRYFPLKYAWAGDTVFTVGNRQVTVPGVASILKELLYGPPTAPADPGTRFTRPSAQRLNGSGLAGLGEKLGLIDPFDGSRYAYGASNAAPPEPVGRELSAYAPPDAGQPRIVADPYRNAIVVRDEPARMGIYEELVRTLDIPAEVVEIEATIFDLNTDRLEQLGIDWRYADDRSEVLFGGGDIVKPNLANTQRLDSIDVLEQVVPGFQVGAIIGDSAEFVARINALESDQLTEVTARPKVVTLNDVEAVIESSRTVYVPVQGSFEVDLFNVFAGTVLRVTPHVVRDGDRTQIRLLVTVEDGDVQIDTTVSGDTVTNIPIVTRNAVNTQAIIDAGQSLLLGGLDRDTATRTVDKVPVLGDIPVLGRMFRNEGTSNLRSERLFLISPRLVASSPAAVSAVTPAPRLAAPALEDRTGKPGPVAALPSKPVIRSGRPRRRARRSAGAHAPRVQSVLHGSKVHDDL